MTKKSVLKKVMSVVLILLGTTAIAQQTERLPVKSDNLIINERIASQPNFSQARVVPQPKAQVSGKGSNKLAAVTDILVNNNNGATGTRGFTQSETSVIAFGNNVVLSFNDAGSYGGVINKFTGWSYSADGGATFIDGGSLPTNTIGDAGDPVLARNNNTGRIFLSTLGFNSPYTIQMFRSDNNGVSWLPPVIATPGGYDEDKQWVTVDNFAGSGNGNVYLLSRRFAGSQGIYFFNSTDNGNTFGPTGGTLIVPGSQGAYIAVGSDHSIYAFWYAGVTLQMRRSTDQGLTFGAPVTVAAGLLGGSNGDLGLTGIRQGTVTPSAFRSNSFPHAAVNPVNGHIYVTYNSKTAGVDKGDIFYVLSTDNGSTWSAPVKVNDDGTTTDQWQPTVSVSPDGQHIGFFYYSRQEDPVNNNLFKYYGRIGTISGSAVNLTPSSAVSSVASLPEFGRDAYINSTYMGDYNTVSATATDFNVVWGDNRDDLAGGSPRKDPNVYYKKVSFGVIDNEPPVITCPANITASNDAGFCYKVVSPGTATATDNSGTVTISGVRSDGLALTAPYPVGTTTILWKATDPSNNSSSCTQTIIINDTELPNALCKNVSITLINGSATISAADVNNASTDNCGIKSVAISKSTFSCADIGPNTITLTVTDVHNNVNTCTATVTVIGAIPSCNITSVPENNIYTGGVATNIYLGYGPQKTTLQVSAPASGAPYTYSWSGGTLSNYNTANPVFAPTAAGSFTFTVLVTNKYGCTGTCSITINVYDIRVPGTNGQKVYVCHAPNGNPSNQHTIAINVLDVPSHVPGHSGDHLGSCNLIVASSVNISSNKINTELILDNISSMVLPYPNPNKGSFNLVIDKNKFGRTEINILNNKGAIVEKRSLVINSKRQVVHFDLKNISAGMYFIQIVTKDGTQVSKIMINR